MERGERPGLFLEGCGGAREPVRRRPGRLVRAAGPGVIRPWMSAGEGARAWWPLRNTGMAAESVAKNRQFVEVLQVFFAWLDA